MRFRPTRGARVRVRPRRLAGRHRVGERPRPAAGRVHDLRRGDEARREGRDGATVPAAALNTECPGVQSARRLGRRAASSRPPAARRTSSSPTAPRSTSAPRATAPTASGQEVTMQLDTTTIGVVGTVAKMTSGEGEPGNDWALIRIDPAVAAEWGVDPAMPVIGGPQGVYTGCDPDAGLRTTATATASPSARARSRAASPRTSTTTATAGRAPARPATPAAACSTAPGGPAIGNFTHLIVDTRRLPRLRPRRHPRSRRR